MLVEPVGLRDSPGTPPHANPRRPFRVCVERGTVGRIPSTWLCGAPDRADCLPDTAGMKKGSMRHAVIQVLGLVVVGAGPAASPTAMAQAPRAVSAVAFQRSVTVPGAPEAV